MGQVNADPNVDRTKPNDRDYSDSTRTKGTSLVGNPFTRYIGFSLLLTYHYVLWFGPDSFYKTDLLANKVTYSWLVNLIFTALVMTAAVLTLSRTKRLSDTKILSYILPIALAITTLLLEYVPFCWFMGFIHMGLAAIAGGLEGLVWILWGECLFREGAHFSVTHIGATFGIILLASMIVSCALPAIVTPIFVNLLVVVSGILLVHQTKKNLTTGSILLPKKASKVTVKNVAYVCLIAFATSFACYYLAAIIPWEYLPLKQATFMLGICVAALVLIAMSIGCSLLKIQTGMFKIFPYLLVLAIAGLALLIADTNYDFPAFLIAVSVSSVLEVSLLMYFGNLMNRGYFAPVTAFALSVISIRAGIALGNSLALFYEAHPDLWVAAAPETALVLIIMLAILLVPMSKRESAIIELTSTPASPAEVDIVCDEIIEEFKLSAREGEILKLIARGNTAANIANKLVISSHTVNTHIRHIYDKIDIHKRSELIDYINMRRNDS